MRQLHTWSMRNNVESWYVMLKSGFFSADRSQLKHK